MIVRTIVRETAQDPVMSKRNCLPSTQQSPGKHFWLFFSLHHRCKMTEVVKYSVVYQGSKLFWRTRHTIDITIVQHIQLDITEIIAFKPAINVEAKRIYLNSTILQKKLNQDEIDSKFSFAKQNNVPISVEFTDSVMHHAISDFILPRLIISELRKEERYFAVKVELRSSDRSPEDSGDSIDNLVCAQPAELQPYETKNHKRLA